MRRVQRAPSQRRSVRSQYQDDRSGRPNHQSRPDARPTRESLEAAATREEERARIANLDHPLSDWEEEVQYRNMMNSMFGDHSATAERSDHAAGQYFGASQPNGSEHSRRPRRRRSVDTLTPSDASGGYYRPERTRTRRSESRSRLGSSSHRGHDQGSSGYDHRYQQFLSHRRPSQGYTADGYQYDRAPEHRQHGLSRHESHHGLQSYRDHW